MAFAGRYTLPFPSVLTARAVSARWTGVHNIWSILNPATRPIGTAGDHAFKWRGRTPRKSKGTLAWQATQKIMAHVGGAVTVIPPNIWQDNFLTGSSPYAVYPRRVSSAPAPF